MAPHRSASQLWPKTAGILVFGTLVGLWLGHQDKGYQPCPTRPLWSLWYFNSRSKRPPYGAPHKIDPPRSLSPCDRDKLP
jgi:hypothetical protein